MNVVVALNKLHDFYGGGGGAYKNYLFKAEVVAHELAHGAVLGLNLGKHTLGTTVHDLHDGLTCAASDESEINTLAVEWLAMRDLGVKLSMRRLAYYASNDMKTKTYCNLTEKIEAAAMVRTESAQVKKWAKTMEEFVRGLP